MFDPLFLEKNSKAHYISICDSNMNKLAKIVFMGISAMQNWHVGGHFIPNFGQNHHGNGIYLWGLPQKLLNLTFFYFHYFKLGNMSGLKNPQIPVYPVSLFHTRGYISIMTVRGIPAGGTIWWANIFGLVWPLRSISGILVARRIL